MPNYQAMFGPDDVEGPDYEAMFGPEKKSIGGAISNAGQDVKDIASETYKSVTENPREVAAGTADYLLNPITYLNSVKDSVSNLWEGGTDRAYEHPVRSALDVANVLPPVPLGIAKAGMTAVSKGSHALPEAGAMPRAAVREGKELVGTGGLRMKIAKLDPAKVDAQAIAGPMQKFRDALKTDAIELGPDIPATLMNRISRLDSAYTPNKRPSMSGITKVEAPEKPPVSLGELHKHSQKLNEFINSTGKTEGKINENGKIAIMLRKSVDEMIDTHPESPSFKTGRNEVHRGKMSESFDEIHRNASLTSQWRNGNEVAALQNAAAGFLKAKKNKYAFTPEVRRKLERFSRDKKGRLLSAFGSKTVSGQAAGRLVESAFGVPGLLWGPGIMAREARKNRMMDEWQRISEEIRAGGPVE
jgi:hypothetical protein